MHPYLEAISPYLLPGLISLILTIVLVRLALWIFPKVGLMDRPHLYGLTRKPIPYSGGLILFLSLIICVILFMDFNKHLIGVMIAAGMLVFMNFWDDRHGLNPFFRLLIQILAALTVVMAGIGITSITNPLGGTFQLDSYQIPITINNTIYNCTLLADIFTIFWIVALINTTNWLDGVPGLVSGISAIGSIVLFFLSIRPDFHYFDQTAVATLAIIITGISLGFWFFDFSPPKILMGDTGSMLLGFLLAILAIFSGGKIATAFLIMGFPILDFAWVIGRRIWQGVSPFKGDRLHFHHRLLGIGFGERQVALTIYIFSAIFGGIALFLGSFHKLLAILIMVGIMGMITFFIRSPQKQNPK